MVELKLGNVESQFADIIWNHEPIPSGELVKICEKELEWKNQLRIQCLSVYVNVESLRMKMESYHHL